MRPRLGRSLTVQLVLGTGFVLTISSLIWVLSESQDSRRSAVEAVQTELRAIATTLAIALDGDAFLSRGIGLSTSEAVFEGAEAPEAASDARELLLRTRRANGLSTEIHALRLDPTARNAVLAEPDRAHPGAMQLWLSTSETPLWRGPYDYRPEMKPALFGGQPAHTDPYEDRYGQWVSAYAPIQDREGRIVGVVDVERRVDAVLGLLAGRQRRLITTGLIIFMATLLIAFGVVRRVAGGIEAIAAAAEKLGAGDYETRIDVQTSRETRILSQALDGARARIRAHLEERARNSLRMHEALQEARRAAKTQSEFLSNVTHELRTPLAGVVSLTEHMLESPPNEDLRTGIETVKRTSRGLLRTLEAIIDYAQLEAGTLELNPAPFSARTATEETVANLEPLATAKGLTLDAQVDPAVPAYVRQDETRFRQVLEGLILNAVKFTEKGDVLVRLQYHPHVEPTLLVEVQDTGVGIAPELHHRLFEPFVQADAGLNRRFGGTGLGLALGRRLVELMRGHLAVDSTPGKGSRFFFTLPAPPAGPPARRRTRVRKTPTGTRVLVAEDNRINQRVAQRTLEQLGYIVDLAADGAEAVRACQIHQYDLVLMDCQMPGIDGLEATRRIRQTVEWGSDVPIVAVTANNLAGDREQCLGAGMDAHLAKPFSRSELAEVLEQVLEPWGPEPTAK